VSPRGNWFLRLPAKMDSLHSNKENPSGDLIRGMAIRGVQADDLTFHAAPSFWPGKHWRAPAASSRPVRRIMLQSYS
jgi:hypothetical protein